MPHWHARTSLPVAAAAVVASGLAAQFLGPAGLGAAGIAGERVVVVVRVSLIV